MAATKKPGSLRSEAARLTPLLGIPVSVKMIREWKAKRYPLQNLEKLRAKLRNQERNPLPPVVTDQPPPEPPAAPSEAADLDAEIERIKSSLLTAQDYETARLYAAQIRGLHDLQKLLISTGKSVSRESQLRDSMTAGGIIRQLVLKIPVDIPPMVAGLSAAESVAPLTDYAHSILAQLSDASTYFKDQMKP